MIVSLKTARKGVTEVWVTGTQTEHRKIDSLEFFRGVSPEGSG
jgi:hypothetical protein